jgi:hypothetical protein
VGRLGAERAACSSSVESDARDGLQLIRYVLYIRLARFSFLILIGRFATLDL